MSNHKSTESAIKNLEIQVGQLAKKIAENSSRGFGANTEKNPKKECKVVMTRSKREIIIEDESRTSEEKELGAEGEKENKGDHMEEAAPSSRICRSPSKILKELNKKVPNSLVKTRL